VAALAIPVALGSAWAVMVQGVWQWRLVVADPAAVGADVGSPLRHVLTWTVPLTALVWVSGAPWLRRWYGWSPLEAALGDDIFRIGLVTAVLGAVVQLQSFAWRGRGADLRVEWAMFIGAVGGASLTLLTLGTSGVRAAAHGALAQVAVAALVLRTPSRHGPRLVPAVMQPSLWRETALLGGHAMIGRLTLIVDRALLAGSPVGVLTLFSVGQSAVTQLAALIARSLTLPEVAPFLRARTSGDLRGADVVLRRASRPVLRWVLIGATGAVLASEAMGMLGFTVGRLTPEDLAFLFRLIGVLALTVIPGALGALYIAALQAGARTAWLVGISVAGLILSTAAKLVAVRLFGVIGLAVAVVCHYALNYVAIARAARSLPVAGR
jgi:hypothetical protein